MNSSNKLIYIANLRLPTEKAYGIQIAKMCEAFAGLGRDVDLIAPYRISKDKDDLFAYYGVKKVFKFRKIFSPDIYLPGKFNLIALGIKNFISALILTTYVLAQKPDIIYSRDESPIFLLSFFNKHLIYEAHRFSSFRRLFYKRFKDINLKVIVITKRLKEDFVKIGFKPENVLVAPDGVDLNEFGIDMSKETARARVGLPLDKKIVMYAGHLFEWKGADILARTAELIKDALFVFVGGTEHDINNFRDKYGDKENIKIVGFKPYNEIPIYLKAADILVLPNSAKEEISRSYTSPLKMFEYMASGRPIIASELPSIREVLNQNNSLLVEPDNDQQLAEAIKKVINDPSTLNQLAQKAFEDVKHYTWQKRAGKILSFIG